MDLFKKKIKAMNIKSAINSQLSEQLNLGTKLRKQPEQEQNHTYGDHLEDISWEREG